MSVTLETPGPADLPGVSAVLATWQRDDVPVQLHPGDLGWASQIGMERLAKNVRTWSRDGRLLAIGMLDGADLIRMALDPQADDDADLAATLVEDFSETSRRVLPAGDVAVEARFGAALRHRFHAAGWTADEPWTLLARDLTGPVPEHHLLIEDVTLETASDRVALQRSAFTSDRFTLEHWRSAVEGPLFRDARDLIGRDEEGRAVAMATVWSAGIGRPGVIEPLGAHAEHRGLGHGRAMTLAAVAALRELGSSSAIVATPRENVGAIAAYASAGVVPKAEVTDFRLSR